MFLWVLIIYLMNFCVFSYSPFLFLPSQDKTREQREAELIPRVTSALKLGIDVVDSAFEKLDTAVVDSDSEDEDGYRGEPILEAKVDIELDRYTHRHIDR